MKNDPPIVHFTGRLISVTTEEVTLPNGQRTVLEIVHHPGGAAAVALDERRRVCLLRQYRHVAGGWLWELPAGKLEPNEPPLKTAQRELAEEAGVRARQWRSLGTCLSSPGVFTERLHLYLATAIELVATAHERSEVIEIHWLPLEAACVWALDGTINDCKSAIGLLRAQAQAERSMWARLRAFVRR
jgi:ADP-ribose pyrophosphatase